MEQTLYQRLQEEYYSFNVIANAARDVEQTFTWLEFNKASPLILLDFDVLYGGLYTQVPVSLTRRTSTSITSVRSLGLLHTIGPRQLRALLDTAMYMSLPPGAAAELLSWQSELLGTTTSKAQQILTMFERAQHAQDPVAVLLESQRALGGDLLKVVTDQLISLHTSISDATLVRALAKRVLPWTELVGPRSENLSTVAYRVTLSVLNERRQKVPFNNFLDALNVQSTVRIFNSLGRWQDQRIAPVLVSVSPVVSSLNMASAILQDRYEIPPTLINNVLYLRISQRLFERSPDSCRNVGDQACLLFRRADQVAQRYRDALHAIALRVQTLDTEAILRDKVLASTLSLVIEARERFVSEYRGLLASDTRDAVMDEVSRINEYLSVKIRSDLASNRTPAVKDALREVRELVHSGFGGISDLWSAKLEYNLISDPGRQKELEELLFDISLLSEVPQALAETAPGMLLSDAAGREWAVGESWAIVVHGKGSQLIALLRVECAKNDDGVHRFIIRWAHNRVAVVIWEACGDLMRGLCGLPQALCSIWLDDRGTDEVITIEAEGLSGSFAALFRGEKDATHASMSCDLITLRIDFEPRNGLERQCVLELGRPPSGEDIEHVSLCLSQTLEESIPRECCKRLLDKIFAAVAKAM
ncbi:MAG: hypothetical protein KJ072_21130 [Verrucomicrobia bacterium]|nr:hypothetical protein [Verrucomicrobiota bacterium]